MTRRAVRGNLERLLMLTLSVEQSCQAGEATVVRQLLEHRSRLIDQLDGEDLSGHDELLAKVAEGDRRLMVKLDAEMQMLTSQLIRHTAAGKAKALYSASSRGSGPHLLEQRG